MIHRLAALPLLALAASIALPGCAAREMTVEQRIALSDPAVTLTARGETTPVPGVANADAADDPAIWRNPADPAASLIVGTDKKAGLYVYGLDGKVRDFNDAGRVNNVDLLPDVIINGQPGLLVVASERNGIANAKLVLFRLDTATAKLLPLGIVGGGAGEAYGICLYRDNAGLYAFSVLKDGSIHQVELVVGGAAPTGRIVRSMKLGTQSEGCATDPRTARLYVAEEDVGLWRFDAAATAPTTPVKVGPVDGKRLVNDAEGVAIVPVGDTGGYVVVSSQGDNAYALWRIADDSYVGRFRVKDGRIGGTEETDGIEIMPGDFGPQYPGGLMVIQDGHNGALTQNFKLVAWDDVKAAIGLKDEDQRKTAR